MKKNRKNNTQKIKKLIKNEKNKNFDEKNKKIDEKNRKLRQYVKNYSVSPL